MSQGHKGPQVPAIINLGSRWDTAREKEVEDTNEGKFKGHMYYAFMPPLQLRTLQ